MSKQNTVVGTLYKRNVNGSTQVWWMERVGGRYRTHSGQLDGKITVSEWTQATPKNVGRANETSSEAQAQVELEAAYVLKRKKGYRDDLGAARTLERFTPMLAKVYADYQKDVHARFEAGMPVITQPKLDGVRCIATSDGLFSRAGNPIVAVPHILEALQPIFELDRNARLDGELYNHELKEDFPALVSLLIKKKPSAEDLAAARAGVQYWMYDIAAEGDTRDRARTLHRYTNQVNTPLLRRVTNLPVYTAAALEEAHAANLEAGYEGTMIRFPDAKYEQKRVKTLLKYKVWMDDEFSVVDICEGLGNSSGMAQSAIIRLKDGSTNRANIKGTREFRRQLLLERAQYIGGKATIEFFDYTPDGKLRFPRVKVFHGGNRTL
jgi:ATP-dependent DNA ligase